MIPRKAAISLSSTAVVLMLASAANAEEVDLEKLERHCWQVHAAAVQGMLDSITRDHLAELGCGINDVHKRYPLSGAAMACSRATVSLARLFNARPESETVPPDVCKN